MMDMEKKTSAELLSIVLGDRTAREVACVPLAVLFGLRPARVGEQEPRLDARWKLAAAMELVYRAMKEQVSGTDLTDPGAAKDYAALWLARLDREACALLLLSDRGHLLWQGELVGAGLERLAAGSRALIGRSAAMHAMAYNARVAVFATKRESADAEPTDTDRQTAEHLRDVLALLQVRLADYIIVGGTGNTVSLSANGLL